MSDHYAIIDNTIAHVRELEAESRALKEALANLLHDIEAHTNAMSGDIGYSGIFPAIEAARAAIASAPASGEGGWPNISSIGGITVFLTEDGPQFTRSFSPGIETIHAMDDKRLIGVQIITGDPAAPPPPTPGEEERVARNCIKWVDVTGDMGGPIYQFDCCRTEKAIEKALRTATATAYAKGQMDERERVLAALPRLLGRHGANFTELDDAIRSRGEAHDLRSQAR